jgi:hypothetical protein
MTMTRISPTLPCPSTIDPGVAHRYLGHSMTAEDAEAFEAHYLTCARCQADLRVGIAVRSETASTAAPQRVRRSWPRRSTIAAATVAAAVGIGLAVASSVSDVDPRVAALGAVGDAPVYLGLAVRVADDVGSRSVAASLDSAMESYASRRYDEAAERLARAAASGADSIFTGFFRAASLQQIGATAQAIREFERVIAHGESPYLTEAHYYRAKGLLALGEVNDARSALSAAAGRSDAFAAVARALADSLRVVTSR